jgi:hypothetical protein
MRILFCNKYNHPFSGTEVYLFELMDLLRAQGHEVALFSMADPRGQPTAYDRNFVPHIDFKENSQLWQKARRAGHAIYSIKARRCLRRMIQEFRPDIAHLRNIYHHLSPSILWELKAQGIPVLYHVNDFKLLCPSYNLLSCGEVCEACKGGTFWHAMRRECYPGLGARITLTLEAYVHRWLQTYKKCIDLFLAPSRFVRDKFVEHGWDATRFEVLPHFQLAREITGTPPNAPMLYFGRLSAEKGIDDLALHFLAKKNIMAVKNISSNDMEKLAKATGGTILASTKDLAAETLGEAKMVEEVKIGDDKLVYVRDCKNPRAVTVVIRGGSDHVVDEAERSFHDALCVVRNAVEDQKVVAGGGAPEAETAKQLREYAVKVGGREQLAIEAFAESMESVPLALAENAGLDPIDIMVSLRAKHENPEHRWYGVDVYSGEIKDMRNLNVIEPLRVKVQVVKSATEAASMILRIDDVVASKGGKGGPPMPPGGGGMPGGMGGMPGGDEY